MTEQDYDKQAEAGADYYTSEYEKLVALSRPNSNLSEARLLLFWSRPKRGNDGCLEWPSKTYGRFVINGNEEMAHRISYLLINGPIPDGLVICHKCDNPRCVNPEHLFAGTMKDNTHDMVRKGRHKQAGQTHCKHGHSLALAKKSIVKSGWNYRRCLICKRAEWKVYYEKNKKEIISRQSARFKNRGK